MVSIERLMLPFGFTRRDFFFLSKGKPLLNDILLATVGPLNVGVKLLLMLHKFLSTINLK